MIRILYFLYFFLLIYQSTCYVTKDDSISPDCIYLCDDVYHYRTIVIYFLKFQLCGKDCSKNVRKTLQFFWLWQAQYFATVLECIHVRTMSSPVTEQTFYLRSLVYFIFKIIFRCPNTHTNMCISTNMRFV